MPRPARRPVAPSVTDLLATAQQDIQVAIQSLTAVATVLEHCVPTHQLTPAVRDAIAQIIAQAHTHGHLLLVAVAVAHY